MAILTDQEFIDAVQQTPKIIPRSLWQHLNEIAQYLALIGDVEAAYDVWRFAYQDIPYIPGQWSDYGDVSVTALCDYLETDDLSRGHPASDLIKPEDSMDKRLARFDRYVHRHLTTDPWHQLATSDAIELMRTGLRLARPPKGVRFSPTERESLFYFDQFVRHSQVQDYAFAITTAYLLSADIAMRYDQHTWAVNYLRSAMPYNGFPEHILGLRTTSRLAFEGVLKSTSNLTGQDRRNITNTLLASGFLPYLATFPHPLTEITIWPDYSTLSFEPSWDADPDDAYNVSKFEKLIPIQPDEPYPVSVHLSAPWNTGDCIITVEYAEAVPDWNEAMHVYSFPIRVVPNPRAGFPDGVVGTLFPSTLPCGIGDEGFEVPPGEYDALARFFFVKDSDIGFDYRVIVSLMPRGIMAHGILKLDEARLAEIRNGAQDADLTEE